MSMADTRAYLMAKSAPELIEACGRGAMSPHDGFNDGRVIGGELITAIRDGAYEKVPVLLGSN